VDKFDHRGKLNVCFIALSQRLSGEQGNEWSQSLATGINDIVPNVLDHIDIGGKLFHDQRVHRLELSGNGLPDCLDQLLFSADFVATRLREPAIL